MTRGGEECYVRREHLSEQERSDNAAWLRASGRSFIKHADALDAETEKLRASGAFDRAA